MANDPDITPTPTDVAALMRNRTKDEGGRELGDFTSETTPTDVEVEEIIARVETPIKLLTGSVDPDTWPEELVDSAKQLIVLRSAMAIELSYYSEQVTSNQSPYNQWRDQYKDDLNDYRLALSSFASGGSPGPISPGESSALPHFYFGDIPGEVILPNQKRIFSSFPGLYQIQLQDGTVTLVVTEPLDYPTYPRCY